MTTREKLHAEIDNLDEKSVDAVYQVVQQYAAQQREVRSGGLLSKLQEIKIDGPVDFSINLDHYLYGVERVQEDLH